MSSINESVKKITDEIATLQKNADTALLGIHTKLENLNTKISQLKDLTTDEQNEIKNKLTSLAEHIDKNAKLNTGIIARLASAFVRGITGHGFKSAHTQIIEKVGKIKGDLSEQKTSLQKVKKSMLQKSPTQTTPLLESKIIGKDQRNSKGLFETKINKEAVLNMQIIKQKTAELNKKTAELNKRIDEIDSELEKLEAILKNSNTSSEERAVAQNKSNPLYMEKASKLSEVRELKRQLESLKKK